MKEVTLLTCKILIGKMELRKQYWRPHARIYGKMKHYLVDGTGRDTYIKLVDI